MSQEYLYAWGNNPRRAQLQGRACKLLASGKMNTVLVEFLDTGERVTTSKRALRPKQTQVRPVDTPSSSDGVGRGAKPAPAAGPEPSFPGKTLTWKGLSASYDPYEQQVMRDLAAAVERGEATRDELEVIHSLKALFDARIE